MFLDQLGVDVSGGALPAIDGLVDDVGDLEAVGVGLGKGIELVLEDDVLRGNVGKDEVDLGLVGLVLEETLDDLDHGRNTGSSSNQADSLELVRLERMLANRAY